MRAARVEKKPRMPRERDVSASVDSTVTDTSVPPARGTPRLTMGSAAAEAAAALTAGALSSNELPPDAAMGASAGCAILPSPAPSASSSSSSE